jgi:L-rhamnose mutarotase
MDHVLFVQKVRPEKKLEYIRAHEQPPAELMRLIRQSGVQREIIWLHGENLYIYLMAEDVDEALAFQSRTKLFQEWVEKMTPLLSEIQDYSGKGSVVKLEKVFDLEEQLARLE